MAKRFINEPSATVADLMQGLSLDSSRVTLLDPEAGHHVAIRTSIAANTQTPRVAVVSGGGSGHEPMAAGYVADGMLAAAVAGDVYASPSVPAISSMLETIAPRSTGILVVVMNYQGDRLNFRKAVEHLRSKKPGYPVHMMLVDDDVALPNAEAKRGIAGSVFVLKVAGAAADQGRPLAEVVNIAETAARSIASFGVALEPCTLPGHHVDPDRLSPMEIELGMGIHGEPGAETLNLVEVDKSNFTRDLIGTVCRRLDQALSTIPELPALCTGLAIMVNNLGAVAQSEMLIVANAVAHYLYNANATVLNGSRHHVRLFVGSFMTSLQMTGVSISCFMLPSDYGIMEQLLISPTASPAWSSGFILTPPAERMVIPPAGSSAAHEGNLAHIQPAANDYYRTPVAPNATTASTTATPRTPSATPMSTPPVGATGPSMGMTTTPTPSPAPTPILRPQRSPPQQPTGGSVKSGQPSTRSGLHRKTEMFILTVTSSLQSHKEELTMLDQRTGDGDFGDTVWHACKMVRGDLEHGRYASVAGKPGALFQRISESLHTMGGTSGVLTRIFLLAAGQAFDAGSGLSAEEAWRAAFMAGTMAVMSEGGANVGDRTAVDALKPAADVLVTSGSVSEAARAARVGCEGTKSMTKANRGRSAHVRAEKLLNQADPGAVAVCIILDALVSAAS